MISIIIPSVRDYRWKDILREFGDTNTDFEIIVCGPCPPQDLGPKFRVIQTNVKATQCIEIGARQSKGEYLFFVADDLSPSPKILDALLACRLSHPEDLIIVSPRLKQLGVLLPIEAHRFPCSNKDSVQAPDLSIGMFISRKDWNAIGGVDRNFVKGFWDLDVTMRCWTMGGRVVIVPDIFMDEVLTNLAPVVKANIGASYHQDLPYLISLWTDGAVGAEPGTLRFSRAKPFEPYINEGIMEADQGVPEINKGVCQHFDAALAEYMRTGKSMGCPDRKPSKRRSK